MRKLLFMLVLFVTLLLGAGSPAFNAPVLNARLSDGDVKMAESPKTDKSFTASAAHGAAGDFDAHFTVDDDFSPGDRASPTFAPTGARVMPIGSDHWRAYQNWRTLMPGYCRLHLSNMKTVPNFQYRAATGTRISHA